MAKRLLGHRSGEPSLPTGKYIFPRKAMCGCSKTRPIRVRPLVLQATRKPRLLLRLSGLLLFRFDTRQLTALLFQLPPRFTRLEPSPHKPVSFWRLPRHVLRSAPNTAGQPKFTRLYFELQATRKPRLMSRKSGL